MAYMNVFQDSSNPATYYDIQDRRIPELTGVNADKVLKSTSSGLGVETVSIATSSDYDAILGV